MSTALRTYWRGATLAAMQDHVAGVTRTYHLDHQGTVQCLTDDNGVVTDRFSCDAWGNQFKRTGTSINRHWYIRSCGTPHEETRRARYATPGLPSRKRSCGTPHAEARRACFVVEFQAGAHPQMLFRLLGYFARLRLALHLAL